MVTEHIPERGMEQVRGRVVTRRITPALLVHPREHGITHLESALLEPTPMNDEVFVGFHRIVYENLAPSPSTSPLSPTWPPDSA